VFAELKVEEEGDANVSAKNDFDWLQNESFATAIKADDAARYCRPPRVICFLSFLLSTFMRTQCSNLGGNF